MGKAKKTGGRRSGMGKKLIFFIDALEFIADCAETKFELLEEILKRNFLLRKIKKVLQILL